MKESLHGYGQVALGVILTVLFTIAIGLFNRIDELEGKVMHTDYLNERFNIIKYRLDELGKRLDRLDRCNK